MPSKEEIKEARTLAGLTQDEAGEVVGTNWKGWQQWEYGVSNMRSPIWELFLLKTKSARKKNSST